MTTLKDIAKEAGVTVMTVSNVINGKYDKVSKSTVETVTEIARRLDYVPSAAARSLVAKSSRLVGVLLPATEGGEIFLSTHNVAVIGVIERLLRENGYYLFLRGVSATEGVSGTLRSWNLDGAIFIGFLDSEIQQMRASFDTPLVVLESYAAHGDFMNVRLDDRKGGYLATRHLIQNGHQRIAFVGTEISERGVDRERYEGYLQALREAGIGGEPVALLSYADTYSNGVEAGVTLCTEHPEVTAVFATADQFAVGIIDGVRSLGRTVPDDLSVVGFDNLEIAATSRPPLTTIAQDLNRKAATAVDLLLQSLQNKEEQPGETILDVELVERESVRNLKRA
ncbi:LacI family DNA-binding transcriptional regulator [Arthrobacter sp. R-11]|uniref:LacI family DNA-binding transcriptional regulator n=1 Tax=Arthrobacter sp. R-11 TaxID=3404053 RepID=UPI003CF42D5A